MYALPVTPDEQGFFVWWTQETIGADCYPGIAH